MPYVVGSVNQIPIAADVKGVVVNAGNSQPFETRYEFYHYNPIVETGPQVDQELFQVIIGF